MAKLKSSNVNGTITMFNTASVNSPPANNVVFYPENYANRIMLSVKGPSGLDSPIQYHFGHSKIGYWAVEGNSSTSPLAFGISGPSSNGSIVGATTATNNVLTRTKRLRYQSAAVANAGCGYVSTTQQWTTGTANTGEGGFFYIHRFSFGGAQPDNPTSFIGMSNSASPFTNTAPNTTLCVGIGTAPGSNNLQLCYGGSTAQPRIDLGDTFKANVSDQDLIELTLFSPQSTANASNTVVHYHVMKINNQGTFSNTGTIEGGSTILPSNTTLLRPAATRNPSNAAAGVAIDLIQFYIETDY
jgi:hypothetical protein